jgi:hypothetical protein
MSHKNHTMCCEHRNVKYCKACQVPYCVDCHQEWGWYRPYYYTPTITYSGGTYQGNEVVSLETTCSGGHKE